MTDLQQKRRVKRYEAHVRKYGACAVCVHRQRERDYQAYGHCRNNIRRQHPTCVTDGGVKFSVDVAAVNSMNDRGTS